MALVNKFVRYLTKRHDKRNEKLDNTRDGDSLVEQGQPPVPMLAFRAIETRTDEQQTCHLLGKIFAKNENVKRQFGAAGENLLYCALKNGRIQVAKFLIQNEVSAEQVTILGSAYHALLEAHTKNRISDADLEDASTYLDNCGCDVDATDLHGFTPFLQAVKTSNICAVKAFVRLNCTITVTVAITDNNALHICCLQDVPKFELFNYLVHLPNMDIMMKNFDGKSPLAIIFVKLITIFERVTQCHSYSQQEAFHFMQYIAQYELLLKSCSLAETAHLGIVHDMYYIFKLDNLQANCLSEEIITDADHIFASLCYQCIANFILFVADDQGNLFLGNSVSLTYPQKQMLSREHSRDSIFTLKTLSRSTIRITMASNGHLNRVKDLPLPRLLQEYVAMETLC